MTHVVAAYYYDGKTSRRHDVKLTVQAGTLVLSGDAQRFAPLAELRVSERTGKAPRRVTFADGAYLEVRDNDAFNQLLAATGFEDSMVVRLQQSWPYALAACLLTLIVSALGYLYGLPAAADMIAKALPEKVHRTVGSQTLQFLDGRVLEPSKLPQDRRDALTQRFQRLVPPMADAPSYEILFRKSKVGPNAFALPSGQIILTDEIIALADHDDAVMGILAHELGHVHERHLMRRIIQDSAVGAATAALFGDVSGILVSLPTLLLDLKYSRDAEREADQYAIAMLKANGLNADALAATFEKLGKKSSEPPPYLSSHPPTAERIEQLRRTR